MTKGELRKRLGKRGAVLQRHKGGSHQVWMNPDNGMITVVAGPDSDEVPAWLERKYLKQLGW